MFVLQLDDLTKVGLSAKQVACFSFIFLWNKFFYLHYALVDIFWRCLVDFGNFFLGLLSDTINYNGM